MTSFERIVRPFQTRAVTPPQRLLSTAQQPVSNVVIECGAVGSTKLLNGSETHDRTYYMESTNKEISRETTSKRITNPDDTSQYVDVEFIDKLTTRGVNGQENIYKYKRAP